MIKQPREISKIMTTITKAGYDVYCAGQCVMASYVGDEPQDWDLYTNCPQDKLKTLFADGEAIGSRVLRLDYTEEVISDDLNVADHLEGVIADIVTMNGTIEDQLGIYDFTVETIAENPQKPTIDLNNGVEDIKALLLKPAGDFEAAVKKDALKMLKVIRYVSLYNFDMTKQLSEIIVRNAELLLKADREDILFELMLIINGKYAGKALKMIVGLNLLQSIVGPENTNISRRGMDEFETLADNIHKIKQVPLRRLALMYMCFGKKAKDAVAYLPYEELDAEYLSDAEQQLANLHFLSTDEAIKKYLYAHGWDKYYFMDKLAKAQAIIYDYNTLRIEGRGHLLEIILAEKQPIFIEDLAIDADDIIEAGITDDMENAEFLLSLLPELVHKKPANNDRKKLLGYAKKFNRNKFSRAFRNVTWLR